jgi:hypothetical protein
MLPANYRLFPLLSSRCEVQPIDGNSVAGLHSMACQRHLACNSLAAAQSMSYGKASWLTCFRCQWRCQTLLRVQHEVQLCKLQQSGTEPKSQRLCGRIGQDARERCSQMHQMRKCMPMPWPGISASVLCSFPGRNPPPRHQTLGSRPCHHASGLLPHKGLPSSARVQNPVNFNHSPHVPASIIFSNSR